MTTTRPPAPADTERDAGVHFPEVDGHRSTSRTGRQVLATAVAGVDPELGRTIAAEDDWRRRYPSHLTALVAAEIAAGDGAAVVPRAGLEAIHDAFVDERHGEARPLDASMAAPGPVPATGVVRGAAAPQRGLRVPYRGRMLEGDELRRQLERWVQADVVEPSFAEAIRAVVDHPDWCDLSDRTIAVLGAGAEMGPLASLSAWGADLALIDLPGRQRWERILDTVRAGAGTARVPLPAEGADPVDAGADLLRAAPEIAAWLEGVEGELTVGNYAYADGATNVRLSVATDAIWRRLAARRDALSYAVLATPTDAYAVDADIVAASHRRLERVGPWSRTVRAATGGRLYAPGHGEPIAAPDGRRFGVADSLVVQQGPNYALAKRLHQWRARAARDEGHLASINVAPSTSTRSVTKNRILAAAFAGAGAYGVEVFAPETSNALMAGLLVHDLRHPQSPARPETRLGHPLELLSSQAAHGGLWRHEFLPRTVLPLAAVRGLPRTLR